MTEESRGKKRCRWCLEDMDIDAKVCPHCRRKQNAFLLEINWKKVDLSTVRWRKMGKLVLIVLLLLVFSGLVLDLHEKKVTERNLKTQNAVLQNRLTDLEEELNDPYRDTYYKSYDEWALYEGASFGQAEQSGYHTILFEDVVVCSENVNGRDELLVKFVCKNQYDSMSSWYFNILQSMYVLADGEIINFSSEPTSYSTSAYVEPGEANIFAAYFNVDKDAEKVEIIYHYNSGGMESQQAFRVK